MPETYGRVKKTKHKKCVQCDNICIKFTNIRSNIIRRDANICDKITFKKQEKYNTRLKTMVTLGVEDESLEGRCNQERKRRVSVDWSFLFPKLGILFVGGYFVIRLYNLNNY